MARQKGLNGQFISSDESKTWEPKNAQAYAKLRKAFPRLLIRRDVLLMVAQGNTKTMAQIKAGQFPRACMTSPKRWREADIRAWIDEQAV